MKKNNSGLDNLLPDLNAEPDEQRRLIAKNVTKAWLDHYAYIYNHGNESSGFDYTLGFRDGIKLVIKEMSESLK